MSTSDLDERKNQTDVSRYAPPRHRTPASEATILPVLGRLSRGASEGGSNSAGCEPPAKPIHVPGAAVSLKFPMSMTGRLAIAVGLIAGLMVVSVTFLKSNAEHSARAITPEKSVAKPRAKNLVMPRAVRTVAVRPETTTVGETQASNTVEQPSPSSVRFAARFGDHAATAVPARPDAGTAVALTAPLKMWAMFPDDSSGAASQPTGAPRDANGNQHDAQGAAPEPATAASHRTAKASRHARRHRSHFARHRVRWRHTGAAVAKPQPAQQQADAAQPIEKTPIQAALDFFFGRSSGGASDSAAPPTTGAAFR